MAATKKVAHMTKDSEETTNLRNARNGLLQERRQLANELTKPYQRGATESLRERFIVVQSTIEAIDRAAKDEKQLETKPEPTFVAPITVGTRREIPGQ
jgi:hypothetical protein